MVWTARCVICTDTVTEDDAELLFRDGRCICLRCYAREVGDERRADKRLIKDIEAAMVQGST